MLQVAKDARRSCGGGALSGPCAPRPRHRPLPRSPSTPFQLIFVPAVSPIDPISTPSDLSRLPRPPRPHAERARHGIDATSATPNTYLDRLVLCWQPTVTCWKWKSGSRDWFSDLRLRVNSTWSRKEGLIEEFPEKRRTLKNRVFWKMKFFEVLMSFSGRWRWFSLELGLKFSMWVTANSVTK